MVQYSMDIEHVFINVSAYLRHSSGSTCSPYIINNEHIIFIVIIHTLIIYSWGLRSPVALRINSEVHSKRICNLQGPDPPAFLYFAGSILCEICTMTSH